jgi:hypothetical protein
MSPSGDGRKSFASHPAVDRNLHGLTAIPSPRQEADGAIVFLTLLTPVDTVSG